MNRSAMEKPGSAMIRRGIELQGADLLWKSVVQKCNGMAACDPEVQWQRTAETRHGAVMLSPATEKCGAARICFGNERRKTNEMMVLNKGSVQASGTVGELLADYAVATKTVWCDVLDGLDSEEKLKAIFGIMAVAFSDDDDDEDDDEDDALADMVRKALRKEFNDE